MSEDEDHEAHQQRKNHDEAICESITIRKQNVFDHEHHEWYCALFKWENMKNTISLIILQYNVKNYAAKRFGFKPRPSGSILGQSGFSIWVLRPETQPERTRTV